MTSKQREVLRVVKMFRNKHKYPPTFREVGDLLGGWSVGAVQAAVKGLVKYNKIKVTPHERRSLEVI